MNYIHAEPPKQRLRGRLLLRTPCGGKRWSLPSATPLTESMAKHYRPESILLI